MAEKTVVVRLKAVVDDYKRAMQSAGDATATVADKAQAWQNLGRSTADLGDRLTRNVTLPIVAVGVAAAKMALDFDNAFTQMRTLAGVSEDEVAALKDSVLSLAGETGKAPQELAEALYFLRSSGLSGAQAMDALEMSAKASAAGLGSTIQVADAVSSAMNAYARSGLTAAEATDVLVATARAGKAEPAELAAQMGRVLPIASELGVTFEDVGAAIASLSLSGNDAAASTTQLTALLSKILRPSQQAREQIEGVGISLDELQDMVAGGDLLGALERLRERLGDNGFANFLEDQQAVLAGLALTGENVEKNREIFAALEDATGSLDNAFATWADSMGSQNAIAFGKFQEAMIRLGDALLPVASDVVGFAGQIADVFSSLSDGQQKAILGFAAFLAAMGPIMSVGGRVVSAVEGVSKAVGGLGGVSGGFAAGLANVGIATAVLLPLTLAAGVALADYMQTKAEAKRITDLYVDALGEEAAGTRGAVDAITAAELTTGELGSALRDAGADLDLFNRAIKSSGDEIENLEQFAESPELLGEKINELAASGSALGEELQRLNEDMSLGQMADLITRLDGLSDRHDDAATATRNQDFAEQQLADSMAGTAAAAEDAAAALDEYLKQITGMFDPLFGYSSALFANRDANAAVAEAQHGLNQAIAEHGPNSLEAAAAAAALTDAQHNAGQSALDMFVAEQQLKAGVEAGTVSVEDAKAMLNQWVAAGFITRATANALAADFDRYAAHVNAIPGHRNTDITTSGGAAATGMINHVIGLINSVPRNVVINIRASAANVADAAARAAARQHGGPVRAHTPYFVGEAGPELFISDQPGTIFPNGELNQLLSGAAAFGAGRGRPGEELLAGGRILPASASLHVGGPTNVYIDLSGAVISSQAQFDRMVANSLRRSADVGRPITMRGRRV